MAPTFLDYAETSPQDLAKKRLYGNMVQLKGALKAIPLFNTVDVDLPQKKDVLVFYDITEGKRVLNLELLAMGKGASAVACRAALVRRRPR